MKPILVTSGEPAGIGPDICLELANSQLPLVVAGDKNILAERARLLQKNIHIIEYEASRNDFNQPNTLHVLHVKAEQKSIPGQLNVALSEYVIHMLNQAVHKCLQGEFSSLVTAPVNKSIINQSGIQFSGHTEFLASGCGVDHVVMMLACPLFKVALVTTHLPLNEVSASITKELIDKTVLKVHHSMVNDFGIAKPKLAMAGLNPHAGEGGYLGKEEIQIIEPAIRDLRKNGIDVNGPFSADTMFSKNNISEYDAFIAMYHDQGLPVLKYAGFGQAVNITLGLPMIRTSVDHGTALSLAGKGQADPKSLLTAIDFAEQMVKNRFEGTNHD